MVRSLITAGALALASLSSGAFAQNAPAPAAAPAKHYTTADTAIGTLLDDPAAKALLQKHLPELTSGGQIEMARGLTLQAVKQYAPDRLTDAILAEIDIDLAKLPAKK